MSILIKGMEMPTNCEECQTVLGCCDELEDGTVWCRMAHGYIGDERTVCPFAPVSPHGRLGDLDALKTYVDDYYKTHISLEASVLMAALDRIAPTIIPADPAEEGE